MKEVKAIAKNIRVTARKMRIPADSVRGMKAELALDVLKYMNKGAARHVRKAVASAVANAIENEKMDLEKLYISKIFVDESVTMKRFRPQSKGRVRQILKRSSHVTVFVTDGAVQPAEKPAKAAKAESKKEEKVTEAEVVEAKPKAKRTTKKAETETKPKATKSKSTTKK